MNSQITLVTVGVVISLLVTGCQNVDGQKLAVGAAALGAVGAAGYYAGKHHKKNKENGDAEKNKESWQQHDSRYVHVQQDQMAKYCIGEVSSKYHVSPRYLTTLPLEHDGDHYAVYGQSNESRGEMDTFMCTFSENGEFRSLRATS